METFVVGFCSISRQEGNDAVRAFLIHPHFALARWTAAGVRCSQVPDDLRDYLRSDAAQFPLSEC